MRQVEQVSKYLEAICGMAVEKDISPLSASVCYCPECPVCGAVACLEHLWSWYYAEPDGRDEEGEVLPGRMGFCLQMPSRSPGRLSF